MDNLTATIAKVETGPAHWPERIDVHKNGWGEAKEGDPSRGFFYVRQDLYDGDGERLLRM